MSETEEELNPLDGVDLDAFRLLSLSVAQVIRDKYPWLPVLSPKQVADVLKERTDAGHPQAVQRSVKWSGVRAKILIGSLRLKVLHSKCGWMTGEQPARLKWGDARDGVTLALGLSEKWLARVKHLERQMTVRSRRAELAEKKLAICTGEIIASDARA